MQLYDAKRTITSTLAKVSSTGMTASSAIACCSAIGTVISVGAAVLVRWWWKR